MFSHLPSVVYCESNCRYPKYLVRPDFVASTVAHPARWHEPRTWLAERFPQPTRAHALAVSCISFVRTKVAGRAVARANGALAERNFRLDHLPSTKTILTVSAYASMRAQANASPGHDQSKLSWWPSQLFVTIRDWVFN